MTMLDDLYPDHSISGDTGHDHLSSDLLIRMLDGELPRNEALRVRAHLSSCPECKASYAGWGNLSTDIELWVQSLSSTPSIPARNELICKLSERELAVPAERSQDKPVVPITGGKKLTPRHYGWIAAIAAAIVLAFTIIPRETQVFSRPSYRSSQVAATVEVNGEMFTLLPYSDPELPMSAPRIVEMQVPEASLAAAGLPVDPLGSALRSDRTVLADVLLGIDGQPLGVHVLSSD
jgi:hypothetical protein